MVGGFESSRWFLHILLNSFHPYLLVRLFVGVWLSACDLIDKRRKVLLNFFLSKYLLLLEESAVVVVGEVLDDKIFCWLLNVIDLNFKIIVIANS